MKVFLDFEASSLSAQSYPVEVAWVFEDGRSEGHLIAPAPDWSDWDPASEAVHGISRAELETKGEPHDAVARHMVEVLSGHELFASAPSWDGKWLSALLRAAGLPRHTLRLRDTDEAMRETATELLRDVVPAADLKARVGRLIEQANEGRQHHPAHRALADAMGEHATWAGLRDAARSAAADAGE